jgi:CRP/FNR family transcriptional regulator, cyclic AMP receptor protein
MDSQRVATMLSQVELFGALDGRTLGDLAERVRGNVRVVRKGQAVFVEGDPGDRMYLLVEGSVKLYVRSRDGGVVELIRHRPPAMFGELAILDGGPRSASAEAIEPATLIPISRDDLIGFLLSDRHALDALLQYLGGMVRRTTRHVADLVFLDLPGRVARQLLLLAGPAGTGEAGGLRTGRVTQSELAEMVGGTRQTVNKALKSFEHRGLIRVADLEVEILEPQRLAALVRG